MCMTCVAQGGPYLVGSAVALRTMAASARRRRLAAERASGRGPGGEETTERVASAPVEPVPAP